MWYNPRHFIPKPIFIANKTMWSLILIITSNLEDNKCFFILKKFVRLRINYVKSIIFICQIYISDKNLLKSKYPRIR